jgi:hypothetical protein
MMIYLDDSRADKALASMLEKADHKVLRPSQVSLFGASDARHFKWAINNSHVVLTADRVDFLELHELVLASGGEHPGVIVVRYSDDPKKDMKAKHIVNAVNKLAKSGLSTANQYFVLNQWR